MSQITATTIQAQADTNTASHVAPMFKPDGSAVGASAKKYIGSTTVPVAVNAPNGTAQVTLPGAFTSEQTFIVTGVISAGPGVGGWEFAIPAFSPTANNAFQISVISTTGALSSQAGSFIVTWIAEGY